MKVGSARPPLLGELETAVMNYMWSADGCEAKTIHAVLGKPRGITLSTIQSTLKRLFEKGLLERHKVSHAHIYRPRISREQFHHGLVGELLSDLMQRKPDGFVSAFVDLTEQAGPEHLAQLEALVIERRKKLEQKR